MTVQTDVFLDLEGETIKNDNKNKIIKYSINLFSEKGYSSVSIRDITKYVGIKESSLYNHFRSKEELLETIFYNFRINAVKIMPPVNQLDHILKSMSIREFLKKGLSNFMELISNSTIEKIWRIVLLERVRNKLAREIFLNDIVEVTLHFLELAFSKWITKNEIYPEDPRELAEEYQYPLFSMIEVYILLKIDQQDTTLIEKRMQGHIEFFVHKIENAKIGRS